MGVGQRAQLERQGHEAQAGEAALKAGSADLERDKAAWSKVAWLFRRSFLSACAGSENRERERGGEGWEGTDTERSVHR